MVETWLLIQIGFSGDGNTSNPSPLPRALEAAGGLSLRAVVALDVRAAALSGVIANLRVIIGIKRDFAVLRILDG